MRTILMADGTTGLKITSFLMANFLDDISMVITTELNDITEIAKEFRVPTVVFRSTNQLIDLLPPKCDIGILAWWPKVIERELISVPARGFFNTHPSFLPYGKGKHPNFWALVENTPYGVSIHKVDEGVDTGPIVARKEIRHSWLDNGQSLYVSANEAILELFKATYPLLRQGDLEFIPNDTRVGTFHFATELEMASQIKLDQRYIARDLLNLLRARTFDGHPACSFTEGGIRYEVSIHIRRVD